MDEITYEVRAGGRAYVTDEDGARKAVAHAAACAGCPEPGAFHRSDIYGKPDLIPPQVFPLRLPTGAYLYPGSHALLPVADRVAAALAVLRRLTVKGTPTMRAAVTERIARLEAYRPQ